MLSMFCLIFTKPRRVILLNFSFYNQRFIFCKNSNRKISSQGFFFRIVHFFSVIIFVETQWEIFSKSFVKSLNNFALQYVKVICYKQEIPRLLWGFLRAGRDSNPRPLPWQGSILTNWTTNPFSLKKHISFLLSSFFSECKYMGNSIWKTKLYKKNVTPIFTNYITLSNIL